VYRQYLRYVGRLLTLPSITIRLHVVAIVHTKPVIPILVLKLVAMATSLRPSISAMSSLNSLTPKTYPRIKQPVAICHAAEVLSIQSVLAPPHTPRGQPISEVGGGLPPCLVWTSSHSHRLALLFRFPDFPRIREWRGSKCRFWAPK